MQVRNQGNTIVIMADTPQEQRFLEQEVYSALQPLGMGQETKPIKSFVEEQDPQNVSAKKLMPEGGDFGSSSSSSSSIVGTTPKSSSSSSLRTLNTVAASSSSSSSSSSSRSSSSSSSSSR